MKILAADTTTPINTVALCENGHILAETGSACGRAHSERLLTTVDWVLEEAGLKLADLDALAISVGPGSFTGIRVGTATWKGLALGARLPLIPVPTLDAMSHLGAFQSGLVCTMLDAKMREVFAAAYRFDNGKRTKLTKDWVCKVETFLEELDGPALFLGDGAVRYRERIVAASPKAAFASEICGLPRASTVAIEAADLVARGVCTDPAAVTPVYLRKSQAEENRAAANES